MAAKRRHETSEEPHRLTRFGEFIRDNGIRPAHLADATGLSREHVWRIRFGLSEPTRPVMIWLTVACRSLLGGRKRVRITQLFDLGDGRK